MTEESKKKKEKLKYSTIQNAGYVLKGIWEFDKPLMFILIVDILAGGLTSLPMLYLSKIVLDGITTGIGLPSIAKSVILLIGAYFLLNFIKIHTNTRIGRRFISVRFGFMVRYGIKSMTMDFENLENPDVLDLASRAQRCMWNNQNGLEGMMHCMQNILNSAVTFIGCVYIISFMNAWMFLIITVLLAVNFIVRRTLELKQKKLQDELEPVNRRIGYLNGLMKNFSMGKDIRIFNMGDWIKGRYQSTIDKQYKGVQKLHNRNFRYEQIFTLTGFIQEVVLYIFLVIKAFAGMGVGDFTLYAGAIRTFSGTLNSILGQIAHMTRQNAEICDYRTFLEYPDRTVNENPKPLDIDPKSKYDIVFENVSFKYPNKDEYALKDVNITIKAGQKLAVVGFNGAGKSTFIKLLCRLYEPTEGRILINGTDIREYSKLEYYKLFSVVFQDIHTFAFTIAENISMDDYNITDIEKCGKVSELAGIYDKIVSLPKSFDSPMLKVIEDDGLELSGGETQKLALARALYKNAPLIILDEPTSALDAVAEYDLYKKFDEMSDEKSSVYISHRLASTRFCDIIAMFDHGKIVQYGTHDELSSVKGSYRKMFELQSRYYREGKAFDDGEMETLISEETEVQPV